MASKDKRFVKLNKKRLIDSFKYALQGIKEAFNGEQNIKIHILFSILVLIFGIILKISYTEWLILLLLIGLVIMSEFFNTAIEYVTDLASPNISEEAKYAKDISAGAVLVIAITSAIIGLIIFIPKLIDLIGGIL